MKGLVSKYFNISRQSTSFFGRAIFGYKLAFIFSFVICVQTGSCQKIRNSESTKEVEMKKMLFFLVLTTSILLVACKDEKAAPVATQTPWVVTATPSQPDEPTATPGVENPVVVINTPGEWIAYESEGGIPYSGTSWVTDVAPDEIEVFTAGPACIAGVCLPGGSERGSVIVLLPGSEVVRYEVTDVIAGSNWHGSYRPLSSPTDQSTWNSLAIDRVLAMQQAPNCTPGKGCKMVDVLIVDPNGVVAQWTINE